MAKSLQQLPSEVKALLRAAGCPDDELDDAVQLVLGCAAMQHAAIYGATTQQLALLEERFVGRLTAITPYDEELIRERLADAKKPTSPEEFQAGIDSAPEHVKAMLKNLASAPDDSVN